MLEILPARRMGLATRHVAWIAVGFFGMLVVLGLVMMRIGADRVLESTNWYGKLGYTKRTIGWDGSVSLKQVEFTPHDGSGTSLRAERIRLDVGGPLALMRIAMRRGNAERLERRRQDLERDGVLDADVAPPVLPAGARLEIEAQGVAVDAGFVATRWLPWLDPASGVLFASLGCRELPGLTLAVANRAGDTGRFDVKFLVAPIEEMTRLSVDISMGGIGHAQWNASIVLPPDTGLLAGDWRQWRLVEQEWRLDDREFVRARNRECARRVGLARPQFIARHALAVKRRLSRWRIALPEPLESAYREHASVGGEIVFRSRPLEPLRLGDYALMSRSQRLGALEAQIVIANQRLPFLLEFLPPRRSPATRTVLAAATPDRALDSGAGVAAATTAGDAATVARAGTNPPNLQSPLSDRVASVGESSPQAGRPGMPSVSTQVAPPENTPAMSPEGEGPGPVQLGATSGIPVDIDPEPDSTATRVAEPAALLPSQGNYSGLVGQRVAILTRLGTTRTGTISVANRIAVTIKTPIRGNMIELRIPAEDIVQLTAVR